MAGEITIDTTKLNEKLGDLYDALIGQGQDASNIVRDEARLLLKQLIKLTPPKTLAQGRNAVAGDLMGGDALDKRGVFFSIQPWMPIRDKGGDVVVLYANNKGAVAVTRSNYRPGAGQFDMKQWHYQHRSKRTGRTFRSKPENLTKKLFVIGRMAVKAAAKNKYVRSVQARVGRMKAAWATAYKGLGGKVPAWINRHLPTPKGIFQNQLAVVGFPSVTMGSSAPGVRGLQHIIHSAVRVRAEAMTRKIKLIVSGYSKDVAQGIRIKNKFRKTGQSEVLA